MDALIVVSAVAAYGAFVALHLVSIRLLKNDAVLRLLKNVVGAGWLIHPVLFYLLAGKRIAAMETGIRVAAWMLSFLISQLLVFFHILCLFGPYETSLRFRLIRELARGPAQGLTYPELLQRYNAREILDRRLARLSASGIILQEEGRYRLKTQTNIFSLIDAVTGRVKKILSSNT